MQVLALTFGNTATASSQYRVYQYIPLLEERGIRVEAIPASTFKAWQTVPDYDAVIVQKKLLPPRRVRWLRRHARRLLFDVDDAIWLPHGRPHHWLTQWRTTKRLVAIAQTADVCIVPNLALGEHLTRLGANIALVPMALDGRQWPARSVPCGQASRVRIGWAGHPVNLGYLEAIEPALNMLRQQDSRVEFVVFSGKRPHFSSLPYEFIEYGAGVESSVIRSFDIGLLPLPDNDFANGKSPIKGLQYMASAVPCVASTTASVREMFGDGRTSFLARSESDWAASLAQLVQDPDLRTAAGKRARTEFENRYEIRRTAAALAELLATPGRGRHGGARN